MLGKWVELIGYILSFSFVLFTSSSVVTNFLTINAVPENPPHRPPLVCHHYNLVDVSI